MGTSDRRPYESATVLDQDLLDQSQDSLSQRLEMVVEISHPNRTLNLSDRSKFIGTTYYSPRVQFPTITKTIGEWLSGETEFSSLEIEVNNSDGSFNDLLPGGANYESFIGISVTVKVGLAEISASYSEIFIGEVTDVAGFERGTKTFKLVCRNQFEKVNVTIPQQTLIEDDWPDIEDEFIGLGAPVIYGDWGTNLRAEAPMVPAYPVNGNDPLVNGSLDPVDPGAGDNPVTLVISGVPLKSVDLSSVHVRRGDQYYNFDSSDVAVVPASDNQVIEVTQKNLMIEGSPYIYASGDEFYLRCVGVDLTDGTDYTTNIVEQARDVLQRFGGLIPGDFHPNWDVFRDKSGSATVADNISLIKSRIWVQESTEAVQLVNSLLDQVRLRMFVNRSNLFELNSLHFENFDAAPTFEIKNGDVGRGSFSPKTDERNNWNRAKADFNFNPASGENLQGTSFFKNSAAIASAGREISKIVVFPNLYIQADVEGQVQEMLKLASSFSEQIDIVLSSRALLKDLGDFVKLKVNIGSVNFEDVSVTPVGMITQIGYDPKGLALPVKVWSFQMVPFPGYSPGLSGITGGSTATITKET